MDCELKIDKLLIDSNNESDNESDTESISSVSSDEIDNQVDNINLNSDNKPEQKGGTSKSYFLRRLARDAPEILDQYEAGEHKSARAAAIAAGIVKVPTPYEAALKAALKLGETERQQLAEEIMQ